ncbi:predicted protein [Lichtheimia corymbifera JMRC:FSU:9682]|uniref:Copper transport protein n=1 Tax=Lichtheimia corymbifera JMRC:FSU:9682 TaxID=1263082 RepID=A0A068RKJ3_9FUNG|nr:predicted protein [Lichtheimia corymbifera JMRC:FSU:9682]
MDGMDMGNYQSSSGGDGGMHMMMSMGTFHWSSTGDAILFDAWMPKSESGYIGACFGLLFLSILSRGIIAIEIYFVAWASKRFQNIHGDDHESACANPSFVKSQQQIQKHKDGTATIALDGPGNNASHEYYARYPKPLDLPQIPPFAWTIDTVRSFLTTFASFVNYLLMLIVMTGNGGFFIVIIVGIFIGEMMFGRFRSLGGFRGDEHAH